MIIYYEVLRPINEFEIEELAAIDVSNLTNEERAAILFYLKIIYGEDCIYQKHYCGHLENLPCKVEQLL